MNYKHVKVKTKTAFPTHATVTAFIGIFLTPSYNQMLSVQPSHPCCLEIFNCLLQTVRCTSVSPSQVTPWITVVKFQAMTATTLLTQKFTNAYCYFQSSQFSLETWALAVSFRQSEHKLSHEVQQTSVILIQTVIYSHFITSACL